MNRWVVAVLCGVVAAAMGGVSWAEEVKDPEGKTLFLKYKCNSCHSVDVAGIAKKVVVEEKEAAVTATKAVAEGKDEAGAAPASKKKPPDLSGAGIDVKADWIVKFLKKLETTKAGKKHMKAWKGTDKELEEVSGWLATMKTAKSEKTADKAAETEKAEKAEPAEKAEKDEPAAEGAAVEKTDSAKSAPETETK
jgi:cbb3-type cytochrome oxidase cytochrome c subunit